MRQSNSNGRSSLTRSIRSLIATSMGAPNMTIVMVPVSGRQLDEVVSYDLADMPCTGEKAKVVAISFGQIDGGLEQNLTVQQTLALVSGMLTQAIAAAGINLPINADELMISLKSKIEKLFDGKSTIALEAVVKYLRNVRVSRSYGSWKNPTSTVNTRFIAAVLGWAFGVDWVNTNCTFGKTQKNEKPKYAVACYGYDVNQLTQTGQPLSVAIPTAQPVAIAVLGFYPSKDGNTSIRYVGTMPNKPMVGDQSTAAPMFIRHDSGAIATRKLIDVIKHGYANANELFANPDGAGNFTFTREILAMSRRNPLTFIANVGIAVAYTNGHRDVVKSLIEKRRALFSATTDLQEVLAKDYSSTPASSGFGRTSRAQTLIPTSSDQLATVGAGASAPNFGGAFETPAQFGHSSH